MKVIIWGGHFECFFPSCKAILTKIFIFATSKIYESVFSSFAIGCPKLPT